jgi:signal peptidase I
MQVQPASHRFAILQIRYDRAMKKRLTLLFLLLLLLLYLFRLYKIDGTSMNYGLVEADLVLSYRLFDEVKRGDMLVMRHPLDPKNRLYIKRCAALPGDRIFEKDRSFYLQIEGNSEKTRRFGEQYDLETVRTEEGYFIKDPYLKYYGVVHNRRLLVPHELDHITLQTIPQGHYFMLGDYRDNSTDSRFFGAVPRSWIYSKVIYVLHRTHDWLTLLRIKEADKGKKPDADTIRKRFAPEKLRRIQEDTKR